MHIDALWLPRKLSWFWGHRSLNCISFSIFIFCFNLVVDDLWHGVHEKDFELFSKKFRYKKDYIDIDSNWYRQGKEHDTMVYMFGIYEKTLFSIYLCQSIVVERTHFVRIVKTWISLWCSITPLLPSHQCAAIYKWSYENIFCLKLFARVKTLNN